LAARGYGLFQAAVEAESHGQAAVVRVHEGTGLVLLEREHGLVVALLPIRVTGGAAGVRVVAE